MQVNQIFLETSQASLRQHSPCLPAGSSGTPETNVNTLLQCLTNLAGFAFHDSLFFLPKPGWNLTFKMWCGSKLQSFLWPCEENPLQPKLSSGCLCRTQQVLGWVPAHSPSFPVFYNSPSPKLTSVQMWVERSDDQNNCPMNYANLTFNLLNGGGKGHQNLQWDPLSQMYI